MTRNHRQDTDGAQLCIPLGTVAAITPDERLRAAFARCHRLRGITFEQALKNPTLKHALELTALSMQRAEQRGRPQGREAA